MCMFSSACVCVCVSTCACVYWLGDVLMLQYYNLNGVYKGSEGR